MKPAVRLGLGAAAGVLTGWLALGIPAGAGILAPFKRLAAAPAVAIAAERAPQASVVVRTTGGRSEIRETVPISRRPGARPRVVMLMRPRLLPNLRPGGKLELSAELQITADCLERSPRCAGDPYRFDPRLRTKLLLTTGPGVVGGERAVSVAVDRKRCRQRPPNREHHCMIVFAREDAAREFRALSCDRRDCLASLVVSAHHRRASRGDRVVIGGNLPDGTIHQDKGRLNAILLPAGAQALTHRRATRRRRERRLPLDRDRKTVVFSQRLVGLDAGEKLAAQARMVTGIGHLPYNVRTTSVLLLAERRRRTHPGRLVRRIAPFRGELAEANGFNCTQAQQPCATRKVGLLRMKRDARRRSGARVPLFLNLVVLTSAKQLDPGAGDRVRVRKRGGLRVRRFEP